MYFLRTLHVMDKALCFLEQLPGDEADVSSAFRPGEARFCGRRCHRALAEPAHQTLIKRRQQTAGRRLTHTAQHGSHSLVSKDGETAQRPVIYQFLFSLGADGCCCLYHCALTNMIVMRFVEDQIDCLFKRKLTQWQTSLSSRKGHFLASKT